MNWRERPRRHIHSQRSSLISRRLPARRSSTIDRSDGEAALSVFVLGGDGQALEEIPGRGEGLPVQSVGDGDCLVDGYVVRVV